MNEQTQSKDKFRIDNRTTRRAETSQTGSRHYRRDGISATEDKLSSIVVTAQPDKNKKTEGKITLDECRLLTGRKERVLNPKSIEEITGTILKVGTLYVAVVLPNGGHLRRIVKNLRLIEHGEPR